MTEKKSGVYVTSADGLADVSNRVFAQTFADCINVIFNYTDEAISVILSNKDTTIVKSIWIKLISLLQANIPSCADKTPLSVKTKKKILSQIYV